MRNALALLLIFSMALVQAFAVTGPPVALAQDDDYQISFTPEQLENLLAPIALYPDPLLAQVLLAATFPDQIDEASRTLRAYGNHYDVDVTNWDVSVKAVAHYPTVLSMMADKIDWTTTLGQAYVNQSSDVMEAIQHLRREARSYGNLVTTPQQEIVETDGDIYIYPANPQYIYVPTYDPAIAYFSRPVFFSGPVIWFGVGFVIGAWLNHDCDWHHHRVFYHGWQTGPVWVVRSRPFIHVNNVYISPRFNDVIINRRVIDNHVNYGALDRYRTIHRDSDFRGIRRDRGVIGRQVPSVPAQPRPDNQIIRRNFNPNDPRIDANRGHRGFTQTQPEVRTEPLKPEFRQAPVQPQVVQPPAVQQSIPHGNQGGKPGAGGPVTQTTPPNIVQTTPPNSVFRGNNGGIDPRDASRRGQFSRGNVYQPGGTMHTPPHVQNLPPRTQNAPAPNQQRRPR